MSGGDGVVGGGRAAYVFQRDQGSTGNWGEVRKLNASGRVAISGDLAVMGAFAENDTEGPDAGTAYAFERNLGGADNWGELPKLTASDAEAHDHFGSSVAASGDTAVVGAPFEDAGGGEAGAAYVFQQPTPTPTPTNTPMPTDTPEATDTPRPTDIPGPSPTLGIEATVVPPDTGTVGGDGHSGNSAGVLAGVAAVMAAGAVAMGGAAWYARRRG